MRILLPVVLVAMSSIWLVSARLSEMEEARTLQPGISPAMWAALQAASREGDAEDARAAAVRGGALNEPLSSCDCAADEPAQPSSRQAHQPPPT